MQMRPSRRGGKTKFGMNQRTMVIVGIIFLSVTALYGAFVVTTAVTIPVIAGDTEESSSGEKERVRHQPLHLSPAAVKNRYESRKRHLHGHHGEDGVHEHGEDGRRHHHHKHRNNVRPQLDPDELRKIIENNLVQQHNDAPHHDDVNVLNQHDDDGKEDAAQLIVAAAVDPNFSPPGGDRFPEYKDGTHLFHGKGDDEAEKNDLARTRREAIKNAMKHAWKGYKDYAWGMDELLPQSKRGHNPWGGMGTTMVDSLDTLWLMNMKEEFWEARDWVRDHLSHDHVKSVSVFETTIRSLGGLLSAYDWSGDHAFLDKAVDLGTRLGHAFDTNSGIPTGRVTLNARSRGVRGLNTNVAEAGTLQIEFRYLGTASPAHKDLKTKSEKVFELLRPLQGRHGGLFPYGISGVPDFTNSEISFGAMGDSFYEYMLKVWLQGGKTEPMYRKMYDEAMDGLHEQLIQKTSDGLTYIAVKKGSRLEHKMDHLACFMAGSLALGAYTDPNGLDSERAQRDLKTGKALAYTCYQMYARQTTGIGPEVADFSNSRMGNRQSHYILRPEVVESFFILNQLTGDPTYREWGWEAFQSIERFCRTDAAYGGLRNVNESPSSVVPNDKMESFFLAETLKYLYLLQDPDTEIDILNRHVFNTEAHPTRVFPVFENEGEAAAVAARR